MTHTGTYVKAIAGETNSFTDVRGLKVGQAACAAVKTGVTVIIPDKPVAMGVDVRGGGPGTRETEALDPSCLVEKVHGLVLSGGSVFGLAAADTVVAHLSLDGVGLPFGPRALPVVPSAILFDLKNGGDKSWGLESPYPRLAAEAYRARGLRVAIGAAGAGFGAVSGAERGGLGTASFVTPEGAVVSAIVAVNSFGSRTELAGGAAVPLGHVILPKMGLVGTNTTIAAVATNVDLDRAACKRLAIMAQDGLARALKPIHTPFDGDTVFALSTGEKPVSPDVGFGDMGSALAVLGTLAADALVAAVTRSFGS